MRGARRNRIDPPRVELNGSGRVPCSCFRPQLLQRVPSKFKGRPITGLWVAVNPTSFARLHARCVAPTPPNGDASWGCVVRAGKPTEPRKRSPPLGYYLRLCFAHSTKGLFSLLSLSSLSLLSPSRGWRAPPPPVPLGRRGLWAPAALRFLAGGTGCAPLPHELLPVLPVLPPSSLLYGKGSSI